MKKPKMPSMDSVREKKFSRLLENIPFKPNKNLIDKIDSKLFPLDANRLFHYKPEVLCIEEYERCLSLAQRRIPEIQGTTQMMAVAIIGSGMQNLMNSIFVKEMRHQDELKRIAVEVVQELFDIPDHLNFLPDMTPSLGEGPDTNQQDDSPEPFLSLGDEDKREMRDEIQKRIILNALVHGSAMHIWKSSHYIVKEKIDEIDKSGTLMMMYDKYIAGVSWLVWQASPEQFLEEVKTHGATQGSNELKFEKEDEPWCEIRCHGINFPVLLHEVTKGAMDYLICRGIPREYSEEQLEYYYAKADDYENEYWHYLMSPTIWNKLSLSANVATQELPTVIARLASLSYKELCDVLMACIDDKEKGFEKLKQMRII